MAPFQLSPSTIARYFYHECERYLRYHATPARGRTTHGIPQPERATSFVTQAILDRGYAWEEEVVQHRLQGRVKVAAGNGSLHQRVHSVEHTLRVLRTLPAGQSIYQPTLEVPASFLSRYRLDPDLCRFPPCRPDLLRLEEDAHGRRLRIIDIKASDALRPSHYIQTALYALILREGLTEAGVDLHVDLQQAGIWLYHEPTPHWFPLETSLRIVERFLREQLPRILQQPLEDVPWHLCFRCEWCEFYQPCRAEAEQTGSVSLLPYLSVGGRRYLREASWGGAPIQTLEDFRTLLSGPDQVAIDTILNTCGSLRNRRERLSNNLEALHTSAVVPHGGSSLAMPIQEQVKIILTLQSDPYSGAIYAASFLRLKGKEVYGTGTALYHGIAATLEECVTVQREFLQTLFAELQTLHQYNAPRTWADQKTMQAYVFDGYEHRLFSQLLRDALDDPALAPYALRLLFYFQDEGLADQHQHPDPEVPYPIVVLTDVIRQLVALPVPLVLRLPEVLQALPSPSWDYTMTPHTLFWFELGNPLKSDAITMAWNGTQLEARTWITDELTRRLRATSAVVDGLRARVTDQLFAWPPKFHFPEARVFQHVELSQLAFIVRYEAFMAAMATRNSRTGPWDERVREGISIPLQYVGGNRWHVLAPLDVSLVEENTFPNRLLVPDGPQGEQTQMGYNDYRYRHAPYSLPAKALWIAAVTVVDVPPGSAQVSHLELEITTPPPLQPGARMVLHPRFIDWNADRIISTLATLDTQPENVLLALIRHPSRFAQPLKESSWHKKRLALVAADGFTPSQHAAWHQLVSNRLTVVWGPPGTGKTYFLARAILELVAAYAEADEVLWVGVTASTHAAIEHLLLEIARVAQTMGRHGGLPVYKLGAPKTVQGHQLAWVEESQVAALSLAHSVVVGGTVYSLRKARDAGMVPCDLLLVDEASQMKFGEFALAIPSLAAGRGRLVLAGDDLQLPPIINGQYPAREDGLPGLHDSVLAYVRARDDATAPYTWQLVENWRMNATLCQFPAQTLYGPQYQPVDDQVARRRLDLRPRRARAVPHQALLDWLVDPDYPLVVGVLDGVQATTENPLEAEIVAQVACDLRARLRQQRGRPYPDTAAGDRQFWQQGLGIVSPHHAQIAAIQQALHRLRLWHAIPFVDTVDKMQGQESQAVLVSYGVSDTETALYEAEFIYSLNRLNVAITRAQAKCIVFLPRPLLEPSLELLRQDKAATGLGFMHALIAYCAAGQTQEFGLAAFPSGAGARLQALRIGESA